MMVAMPSLRKYIWIGIQPLCCCPFRVFRICASNGGPYLFFLRSFHCQKNAIKPGNATNTDQQTITLDFQSILWAPSYP